MSCPSFWVSRRIAALRPFDFTGPGGVNPPATNKRKNSPKTVLSFVCGAAKGGATHLILSARAQWIAPASAFPPAAICLPRRTCGGASAFIAAA